MSEYIFYTTEGFTEAPREDSEVENCQVLGCAMGKNIAEAKNNLIKENPWIGEMEFDTNQMIARQLLNEETKNDISTLMQYIENQYTVCFDDAVFQALQRLKEIIL